MSERQWKYIDGPVVHALTTYHGDHAVFALWCTGERVSRASYVEQGTTCLACIATPEPVLIEKALGTNPCAEVPLPAQDTASLAWFAYRDSKDGLVHDVRRCSLTNDIHVSRCRPNDPMHPPQPVDNMLTCLWCLALRNRDPEIIVVEEPGLAIINTHALQKLKFNF